MSKQRRVRRLWEDDEKIRIVAQTRVPGVSVSQVAWRYDVNANLVFRWLRDPRFNRLVEDHTAVSFLPVEVVAEPPALDPPVIDAPIIWRSLWQTRRQTEAALFEYINGFYNPRRRHSTLGGKSPLAFERMAA
jgi:transposase